MAGSIKNKTLAITGASRGIGLEFTRALLAKGNTIVAGVRTPEASPLLQGLQEAAGDSLHVLRLDVTDPASVTEWARGVAAVTTRIDYLINNAGILDPCDELAEITAEAMLASFRTNALGPLLCAQQLFAAGLLRDGSTIVNMTSKMGSVADNGSGGDYTYRASKAALNIINKSMSIDLAGHGVTSVLLHPGWVITDMTDNEGLITAAESVEGMLGVLESGRELNGQWYDYKGEVVPW